MDNSNVPSIKHTNLNKGEWAEFYVFLKLLGEGRLYTANNLLKKNYKVYLDIISIIRQEFDDVELKYVVNKETKNVSVLLGQEILTTVPMAEFDSNASALFNGIKDVRARALPAPDSVCDFAKSIYVSKPKAPAVKSMTSQFGGKNDIYVEFRDSQTSIESIMGFSIKSKFGMAPTLFNAGSSSQLLYRVHDCNDERMNEFNSIRGDKNDRGWKKCSAYLKTHGMGLEFARANNPTYDANLFLVRESMSRIMAWCMEDRLIHSHRDFDVMETTQRMAAANPIGVPNPDIYYEKAVKDFLMAGFTGMTAARKWDGKEQVSGGYIVVMENGDVLCYHSMDRESFRDYLYRNTHFEYVSTTKYKWSYIYRDGNDYYLPLNVSVRFNQAIR